MKNRFFIFTLSCLVALGAVAPGNYAAAQVGPPPQLPAAGVLPGDFWYPVDRLLERAQEIFTFGNERQARLLADQAAERLAEANTL
ncbi:MAG: hypothetical protein HY984_00040, partial [Candidatus Magasanikbacteria bacterium]|nr:hypothetical protein [Candidatus Magasanikbacteria bacterium]